MCPIGVGNYLMLYPAIALLKKENPQAKLHLLALRTYIKDLCNNDPLWDDIIVFDPTQLKGKYFQQLKIIHQLKRHTYSHCASFFPSNTWQYHLLPFLAGIPVRWGFDYRYHPLKTLSFLSNKKIPVSTDMHDVEHNVEMVSALVRKKLTKPDHLTFPQLFTPDEKRWAKEYLKTNGIGNVIGVHPGSSADHGMDAKRWSVEKFAALIDTIGSHVKETSFLVFGLPSEQQLKEELCTFSSSRCISVEPVSLQKTSALIAECSMMLCCDSGLMHIASCAGVPTAALFGPTDEKRNGPMGKHHLVIRKPMKGFPVWTAENVGNRKLPSSVDPQASLKALTVEDAWEQLRPWLDRVCF